MRIFSIFFALCNVFCVLSQSPQFHVDGNASNRNLGKPEGGVEIAVIQDGATIFKTVTASSGKYDLIGAVDYKKPFQIVFSKPGFVKKYITFDYSKMNEEDLPAGDLIPYKNSPIEMIPSTPGVDLSFLEKEPVAKFFWNETKLISDYDNPYNAKMKAKIEKVLLDSEQKNADSEAKYQAAIKQADILFLELKKYEEALAKYEEAALLKPKETYPIKRIDELDALIQSQKETSLLDQQSNYEYNNLIKAADMFRDQKKYDQAIQKYKEALAKNDEQYPKDQISTLEKLIEDQKKEAENQAKYAEAIKMADMFYNQKSYQAAKEKYTLASQLKPSEQHPKTRLADIEKKLTDMASQQEKKKKFDDAIAAADQFFTEEKWEESKLKYTEAIAIEPASAYASERLKMCEERLLVLAKEKERQQKITDLLKVADELFFANKLNDSKVKYNEVLAIEASNETAKARLTEIEQKLTEAANLAAQEAKFSKLVTEGDAAVKIVKLDVAKVKYEEALAIKVDASVQQKLEETLKKIKEAEDKKMLEEQFLVKKQEGFKLAEEQKWPEAKSVLLEAQGMKQDPSVDAKLKEIEAKLKDAENQIKSEEEYQVLLKEAQTFEGNADLKMAISKYKEAAIKKPQESLPKEKITELELALAELNKQTEINQKYQASMDKGNQFLADKNYQSAIKEYNAALVFKPNEKDPKDKIAEAEKLENDRALAAEKDALFAKLVVEGDASLKSLKLDVAKSKYEEALAIKSDASVQTKLEDVLNKQKQLEESRTLEENFQARKQEGLKLAEEQKWEEAKLVLTEAKKMKQDLVVDSKLKEIDVKLLELDNQKKLDEAYNSLLTEAQSMEGAGDLNGAIVKYKEAQQKKPQETLPKDKIKELELALTDLSKKNEVDQRYKSFLDKGDKLMADKNYLAAIKEYNAALTIKPTEKEPADKAAEAERLEKERSSEADQAFLKILEAAETKIVEKDFIKAMELAERAEKFRIDDPKPKELIKRIQLLINQEKLYTAKLKEAEELVASKQYDKAIFSFQEAHKINESETLALTRIEEVNQIISEQLSKAEKEKLYNDFITKAQISENAKQFDMAINHYQSALGVKENDEKAKLKIDELQKIMNELANSAQTALENKNKFYAFISSADQAFAIKNYDEAKLNYEKALEIDAKAIYPKSQLDECVRLQKLKSAEELEALYKSILEEADAKFKIKSYDVAKENYVKAASMKPEDVYPKKKLEEIDAILNPVVVKSSQLEDLGDPYDNSVMDGYAALVKADMERRNSRSSRVTEIVKDTKDKEDAQSKESVEGQFGNVGAIRNVEKKVSVENQNAEQEHDLNITSIENYREKVIEKEINLVEEKQAENLSNKSQLNTIIKDAALDYTTREGVYTKNDKQLNEIERSNENRINDRLITESKENISNDKQIVEIVKRENLKQQGNYAEKIITENTIKLMNVSSEKTSDRLTAEKQKDLLDNKSSLTKIDNQISEKSNEDIHVYAENKEKLNTYETVIEQKDKTLNDQQSLQISGNKERLNQLTKDISESNDNSDEKRQDNVSVYSNLKNTFDVKDREDKKESYDKNLKNKEEISSYQDKNDLAALNDVDDHNHTIDKVKQMDNQKNQLDVARIDEDNNERMDSKKAVENFRSTVDQNAISSSDRQKGNDKSLTDVNKSINADYANKSGQENDQNYQSQDKIGKLISTDQVKQKPPNTLGTDYPEGVSQETFTRSDENGFMTSVITRRIVVKNGHADVYVRTQTLSAITYSKNGVAISEVIWQRETQGPHLQKNY